MESSNRASAWLKALSVLGTLVVALGSVAGLTVDLPEAAPQWQVWFVRAVEAHPTATIVTGLMALGLLLPVVRSQLRAVFLESPSKRLARAYLLESVRPYDDPLIFPFAQVWTPPETAPAYSKRIRTELRAPKLQDETKVLLEKVWGTEDTADLADVRDLHEFMVKVNPKLARKGLLRWRTALLVQFMNKPRSAQFSLADQARQAAIIDLRMSLMERRDALPQLCSLLQMIHGVTIMTEAM